MVIPTGCGPLEPRAASLDDLVALIPRLVHLPHALVDDFPLPLLRDLSLLILTCRLIRQFLLQLLERFETARRQRARLDRRAHGAARLAVVPAVAELTAL